MRVLLDECLPKPLKRELSRYHVSTVSEAGWAGETNGDLLALAAGTFDVFVTIDRLLATERSIPPDLAVITLSARSNRVEDLLPLMPHVRDALERIRPGQCVRLRF